MPLVSDLPLYPNKLLGRLIYNRVSDTINTNTPKEQAGFNKSCCDQVLSITTRIEKGYEDQMKTAIVFIDLTAAYDTVWREGLITKFLKIIPCLTLCKIINEMLSNRLFKVVIGDNNTKLRVLNNGLLQGSVLAPLLFHLYISDIPNTKSSKYMYADDIALATQENTYEACELNLTNDMEILNRTLRNGEFDLTLPRPK